MKSIQVKSEYYRTNMHFSMHRHSYRYSQLTTSYITQHALLSHVLGNIRPLDRRGHCPGQCQEYDNGTAIKHDLTSTNIH